MCFASITAIAATPSECRAVYGLLASMTFAKAVATRSSRVSFAISTRSSGSRLATCASWSVVPSVAQKRVSLSNASSARTSTGSNQVPFRCRAMA